MIDDALEYVDSLPKFLREEGMEELGRRYHTVAVIGAQSSGKSTLLNLLFGTKFEVLNEEERERSQTTKGIWLSRNTEKDVLVFDIEGTDSHERGDDRVSFEQSTSLFALAMADVLIINMWAVDVGRHAASNYGLLKTIFEINLKLFDQQSQKKISVMVRDFNNKGDALAKTSAKLDGDLEGIWNLVYKDERFKDTKLHDLFNIEYKLSSPQGVPRGRLL